MSKYKSTKAIRNGIVFDSQKEARRYDELMLLVCAGEIKDLKLQPEYTLHEAFKTPLVAPVRAIRYRADFSYMKRVKDGSEARWKPVVEDVKGYRTKEYEIKRKLMLGRGIQVVEI